MTEARGEAILERVRALPGLPQMVFDLLRAIDDARIDLGGLARKIEQDPALAARTLRIANSPFYGVERKGSTV